MELYPNLIYASGHDHSLQYIQKNKAHYIVSGSGSHTSHVQDGKYSEFTASKVGFARLDFYASGRVNLKLIQSDTSEVETIFQRDLFVKPYISSPNAANFSLPD